MGKNAKEIKVISTAKPKTNPYRKDIISDDMGQWKYPGQPTRIHSGDITMQGVPYPVLGIDDQGNQQLMLPGMDYTFPGQYVDEFPMAKNGGTPKSLKKYTSQNIKTSINDLMRRNETLFGPSGKRYYRPMQEGGESNWLYQYDKGGPTKKENAGKKPPVEDNFYKPKTKQEYLFRSKMYADSAALADQGRKAEWIWKNNPNISKEQYDKLVEQENDYPQYEFIQEQYDADKKKKAVGDFKDYIHPGTWRDWKNPTKKSITGKDLSEGIDLRNKRLDKEHTLYSKTWVDKQGRTHTFDAHPYGNGRNGFESIYDPQSGTTIKKNIDYDYPEFNRVFNVSNSYMKPEKVLYKGNKEKQENGKISSSTSSTGWYDPKLGKPKFKNNSKEEYISYHHQTERHNQFAYPKQKILKPDPDAPEGEPMTMRDYVKVNSPVESKQAEPVKQVIQKDTTVQAPTLPILPTPAPVVPKEKVRYRTYQEGLDALKNKAKGNQGAYPAVQDFDYTSKPKKKKLGGWLDEYQDGGQNYGDDYGKSRSNMNMLELSQNTAAPKKAFKFDLKALPHGPKNMQEAQQMVDAKEKYQAKVSAAERLAYSRLTKDQKKRYDEAKAKEEYINNPGFLDYVGQAGYMPLLAMSNPFDMGEKLKELRKIKMNDGLSSWQKFDQMGNISTEATGNALINAATEGITEGLAPVIVDKLAKYGDDVVNLAKAKMQNAHKYNPWAFKPDPDAYYRGIGKEGIEDIAESGIIRSKKQNAYPEPYFSKGIVGDKYAKGYFAELTNEPMKGVGSFADGDLIQTPINTVSVGNPNLKLYKKHWLKGYKEVPKVLPKGAHDVVNSAGIPNPLAIADRIIPRPIAPGQLLGMDDSWNNYSPLNFVPGYGRKLEDASSMPGKFVGFRKFGNSMQDVIERQVLGPKDGNRMGAKQILKEGNWAEPGNTNEAYHGVFEATMNPQIEGSNIKLERWPKRNGVVGTTKDGNVDIPITDPGLSFNRRLPFSKRYVPIDKQKLMDKKFQLATQLPYVQSLVEKYGIWAGGALVSGYVMGGKEQALKNLKTVNKYSVDPVKDWTKEQWDNLSKQLEEKPSKQQGGQVDWLSEFE